jgi:RNA polymerase sigma-70 factor, ECF subfamily
VAAARAGERRAQEALFLRHRRLVAGLVRRHHPRTDDLDDLVHDTFIAAFQALGTLKNPQAFASWIGSTAIRLTHKRLRRLRLSRRLGLAAQEEIEWEEVLSPGCTPEVAAELSELSAILDTFPAKERIALVLRKVFGMSLEEIAEATSASLATVKRRVAAAEGRLDRITDHAAPMSPPAAAGACAAQET